MDTRNAFIRNIFAGNEYRMGKLTPIIIFGFKPNDTIYKPVK
jgi:hypothetical protein